jgi:hypothetical protein
MSKSEQISESPMSLSVLPLDVMRYIVTMSPGAGYELVASCKQLQQSLEQHLVASHGWRGVSEAELRKYVRMEILEWSESKDDTRNLSIVDIRKGGRAAGRTARVSLTFSKHIEGRLHLFDSAIVSRPTDPDDGGVALPLTRGGKKKLYAKGERWIATAVAGARARGEEDLELDVETEGRILAQRRSCVRLGEALGLLGVEAYVYENIRRRMSSLLARRGEVPDSLYESLKIQDIPCHCGKGAACPQYLRAMGEKVLSLGL